MHILLLLGAGLTAAVLLKIRWLFLYSVKIYNYREGASYAFLGRGQLVKKRGVWCLQIPEQMIRSSMTTAYRLRLSKKMADADNEPWMMVCFGDEYARMESRKREVFTKNHIATSPLL